MYITEIYNGGKHILWLALIYMWNMSIWTKQ